MFLFNVGSAEDKIKQELQAVAEGVAASVLHSSTPSNPDLHARDVSNRDSIEDGDDLSGAKALVILFTYYFFYLLSYNSLNGIQI